MRLILASSSPRRAELLRAAGFPFTVFSADVDETLHSGETAARGVARLAAAKAAAALDRNPDAVVIAADTTVVVDGEALGKPASPAEAGRMMRLLSGRTHEVLTGVCVGNRVENLVHVETTLVRMAALTEAEIAWYVATAEPYDKAGGYAIQALASRFVERIDGSYSNVVGLPVAQVCGLLTQLGCDILGSSHNPS